MHSDVEKNTGPYNTAGTVQASFSQGQEKFERIEGSSVLVLVCTVCVFFNLSGIVDIENVQVTVTFLANVFVFFSLKIVSLSYLIKLLKQNSFLMVYYFCTRYICCHNTL